MRSIERGLGGPALKDGFQLEVICLPMQTSEERQQSAIMAIGSWFILREIEIAALRQKHMQINRPGEVSSAKKKLNYIIFVGSLIFFQKNVVSTFFREHPDGGVGKIASSAILGRLFESVGQLRSV